MSLRGRSNLRQPFLKPLLLTASSFLYPLPALDITRCKRICSGIPSIPTDATRDSDEVISLHDAIGYWAREATAFNLLEE